ncbi:MAG: extracellular solute-binding protein [candidate division Zixibacteria bacterium]|nr:extracellular solute-binding protein [candidate division Zixibacteria bacterium]
MNTRKIILLFCLLFVLVSSATAKTTISWWQFWTDPSIKPVIREMVDEFERQNPEIEVELTDLTWANGHEKIVIAFASGTGPDVVELGSDWIAEFAVNGHLADVSEDIAGDSLDYQGWGMADYNGRIYARPWFLGTRVLYANRELLERAGYDDLFMPVNWNDLRVAARKINGLGKGIYGWGSNAPEKHRLYKKYLPFFWSAGARIFTDDEMKLCVVASERAVAALDLYKELHDSCGYVANQRGIEDAFLDGKVGLIISGDWLLKRIENEQRKINFTTGLIPGLRFPGRSFLGGEFLAVNEASKQKEAALKFVRFITSPENQVKFCVANRSANPSSRTAQQDEYFKSNDNLQTFIRQIAMAKHPPVDPNWVFIETALEEAVEETVFGSALPAEALFKARKKIDGLEK